MSISNHQISIIFVLRGGGGGGGVEGIQAYNFGKFDFEIWVEEKGHLIGLFRVCVHNVAHVKPRSKLIGAENQNLHLRR